MWSAGAGLPLFQLPRLVNLNSGSQAAALHIYE